MALLLLMLSFWALFLPTAVPVTDRAVVTARVAIVRAPIAGVVGALDLDVGDPVKTGEVLSEVRNENLELRSETDELLTRRNQLRTRYQTRQAELELKQKQLEGYRQRQGEHTRRLLEDLDLQVAEAERERNRAARRAENRETERRRLAEMRERGLVPEPVWSELEDELAEARNDVLRQEERLERLAAQRANLEQGYFVGEGSAAPPYLQLQEESLAELIDLEIEVEELRRDLLDLERQLGSSEGRLARLEVDRVVAPVEGLIWRRPATTGQFVNAGQELFEIADARTTFVHVYLHRRYMPNVGVGDRARIYLLGEGQDLSGEVTSVQAVDQRPAYETWAVAPEPPGPDHFAVTLRLPEPERRARRIGQLARVVIVGDRETRLARLSNWLTLRL